MMDDSQIRDVLQNAKTIAVVGHSDNPGRTSYQIARFLRNAGYTVYAVNPTVSEIDGEQTYASVQDISDEIDIVDVFRRSEFLDGVVEDAIAAGAKTVWSQLGVIDDIAADKATQAGLNMVMNRCIKVEHMRLL